jgi:hypothetical protein
VSEPFLSRWSRRKRGAGKAAPEEAAPGDATPCDDAPVEANLATEDTGQAVEPAAPDPPPLPAIEEIDATTDVTGFLAEGIPASLRNAALRKVWSLDPAIRDFVGPARDYDYDWSVPGGVPGSGALAPGTDVQGMVARVLGEEEAADVSRTRARGGSSQPGEATRAGEGTGRDEAAQAAPRTGADEGGDPASRETSAAQGVADGQQVRGETSPPAQTVRTAGTRPIRPRRHGGATPV